MRHLIAAGVALCIGVGCGPSADLSSDAARDEPGDPDAAGPNVCNSPECFNHCPDGTETILRGVVRAPNGIDPVPGAVIWVPKGVVNEFPTEVACEVCKQLLDEAMVSVTTNVDGSFDLKPVPTIENQQPGDTVKVVVQMGRFRRRLDVVIDNPCSLNHMSATDTTLPSRADGNDEIPRIAVATGDYDVMECVLLKIGLEPDAFDLYGGVSTPDGSATQGELSALLQDLDTMLGYNIIFLNCSDNVYEGLLADPAIRQNIQTYVTSGGRLYVTDWSYDYVEQLEPFAPRIDFGPGASGPLPEPLNEAAIGRGGISTEATVLVDEMARWLDAIEDVTGEFVIDDDGAVLIEHFLSGWAMQYMVPDADATTVWLEGPVEGGGLTGTFPLTTTFDFESCGRVLFSSYHTKGRSTIATGASPAYCVSAPWSPQERVLEYLIFHVADCIHVE